MSLYMTDRPRVSLSRSLGNTLYHHRQAAAGSVGTYNDVRHIRESHGEQTIDIGIVRKVTKISHKATYVVHRQTVALKPYAHVAKNLSGILAHIELTHIGISSRRKYERRDVNTQSAA